MNSCVTVHRKSRVLGNTSSIASADEDLKFHAADSTSSRRVKGYCIILLVCVHSFYIQKVFFFNSIWSACLFLGILEIDLCITWISKGQCKVKEEAILALYSVKPRKKLSTRHTQIKNLSMPQKTGSFKNIHFNLRFLITFSF